MNSSLNKKKQSAIPLGRLWDYETKQRNYVQTLTFLKLLVKYLLKLLIIRQLSQTETHLPCDLPLLTAFLDLSRMKIKSEQSFFQVSYTCSEYLSFENQENVSFILRHSCQLISIFYGDMLLLLIISHFELYFRQSV